jgi:hypothetical protein
MRWEIPFPQLRFVRPVPAGSKLTLRVQAPTYVNVELPQRGYSNALVITTADPHPTPLAEDAVPARWTDAMDFLYRAYPGGLPGQWGYHALHIDGKGRATAVASGNPSQPRGRREAVLAPELLDKLAAALREQQVWKVEALSEVAYPDEGEMRLRFAVEDASVAGVFPSRVLNKQPALSAIQKQAEAIIAATFAAAEVLPTARARTPQCAVRTRANGLLQGAVDG